MRIETDMARTKITFLGRSLLWATLLYAGCMLFSFWDEIFVSNTVNVSAPDITTSAPPFMHEPAPAITIVYSSQKPQHNG
jgi:hypothetical protein